MENDYYYLLKRIPPFPKRKRTLRVEFFPTCSSCRRKLFSFQKTTLKNDVVAQEKEKVHKRRRLSTSEDQTFTEKREIEKQDYSGQKFKTIGDGLMQEKKMSKKMNREYGRNAKIGKKASDDGPNPPPGMPQGIKNLIFKLAGGDKVISMEKLVVQRKLENSDINGDENRFNIPNGKLREQFLEGDENHEMHQMVNIIDPSLNNHKVTLSKWRPEKPYHVLNGKAWKEMIRINRLSAGMIMQLWAVRADNVLWLVLVNLTPPTENMLVEAATQGSDHQGSSSSQASKGSSQYIV